MLPGWVVLSQELVNRMRVRSIHIYLAEDWELSIIIVADKRLDVRCATRCLPVELIAGEGQNLKTFVFELIVEEDQSIIVPVGEASLGGDIDDHDTLFTPAHLTQLNLICSKLEQARAL